MASITREEIEKLGAGRELDALVAENVEGLGIHVCKSWQGDLSLIGGSGLVTFSGEFTIDRDWVDEGDYVVELDGGNVQRVRDYSTDNAASAELLKYISPFRYDSRFGCFEITTDEFSVKEKTAPLAICKTALLIKMFGAK